MELVDEIRARRDQLVALRRDFHRHPELGFAEQRTAAIVAERLERAGLEVTTGVAGTGVVCRLRGDRPGRTIAWRADMDALPITEEVDVEFASRAPGVMHACGHDGHTAIAIVVAELLAARRQTLPGTVVFVFQPAEELLAGARPMLAARVLDGVDEIYGLHLVSRLPAGTIEISPGTAMASADAFDIEVIGRGAHAASPHLGIDPIAITAHILVGLQQLVASTVAAGDAAVLAIGELVAGSARNIIPDRAVMRGSLRTLHARDRRALLDRLTEYVESTAAAHRGRARVELVGESCPPLVNDPTATARVHRCVHDDLHAVTGAAVLASDDMSVFLAERPGCYFRVGAAPRAGEGAPHHSARFAIDEDGLVAGARMAASVLLECLAP